MARGQYIKTLEHRKKISKSLIGRKLSITTRKKMSIAQKGSPSLRLRGVSLSKEHRFKISVSLTGRTLSLEHRRKISKANSGENSALWRGGISDINERIRNSAQYREWRLAVFKRDNYQCVLGGKEHGSELEADHIKPFAYYKELRFEISNGRTLCKKCHFLTDSWGSRVRLLDKNHIHDKAATPNNS